MYSVLADLRDELDGGRHSARYGRGHPATADQRDAQLRQRHAARIVAPPDENEGIRRRTSASPALRRAGRDADRDVRQDLRRWRKLSKVREPATSAARRAWLRGAATGQRKLDHYWRKPRDAGDADQRRSVACASCASNSRRSATCATQHEPTCARPGASRDRTEVEGLIAVSRACQPRRYDPSSRAEGGLHRCPPPD